MTSLLFLLLLLFWSAGPPGGPPTFKLALSAHFPDEERAVESSSTEHPHATPSAEELQAALTGAIHSGAASVTIQGGTYRFANNTSLLIHNATDLSIRAPDPVELIFAGSAGVSFVDAARVSIENIAIDYDPPPTRSYASITYALVNSSDVLTQDLTIRSAPYMAVTAFTGGGNHTFRRLRFAPRQGARWASQRDAIHFSDVRIGPTIDNSSIGWCGDDFLNIKNTLMLLLRCTSASSCIVINPHVSGEQPIPFGGTSVLATARPGDRFSFYQWPSHDMILRQLRTSAAQGSARLASLEPATASSSLAAEAALLERSLVGVWPWTRWTNQTMPFGTSELWQVDFSAELPEAIWRRASPGQVTLINIDDISCTSSRIHHSNFTNTGSQLGRFKSPNGEIVGNRFDTGRGAYNLEFSALPQWLEGPVRLENITVAHNMFISRDKDLVSNHDRLPFHCGPLCEAVCDRSDAHPQCMLVSDSTPCPGCPNCSEATPWADVEARNNSISEAPPLPPSPPVPAPPGSPRMVLVSTCNSSDIKQQWSFDESHGGQIKSLQADGLCLLGTGALVGPCDVAPRWSMSLLDGATGKWLVLENATGQPCRNLQVYNYSGPTLSQEACRTPPAEGTRGSQNEEWAYIGIQFRSVATEQCCGSRSRPIPRAGLCMTRA
eukprot:COSAG02_NODE_2646_length_8338_cov_5.543634_2_plen_665_part_00